MCFTISKDTSLSYQHFDTKKLIPMFGFKLSYECFRVPFLPLYLLFLTILGPFLHILGCLRHYPIKKDVHHFWSLHPPWRYAPSVGLKHDTNGNFLALGFNLTSKIEPLFLIWLLGLYCFNELKIVILGSVITERSLNEKTP